MSAAKILKRYALITVACGLYALGFNWFFVPNRFTVGGFTGVPDHQPLPAHAAGGYRALVLNIPLFILGWRKIGRDLLISSLYATAVSSLMIDVLASLYTFPAMDPILACIYGGIVVGIGCGMLLHESATTGRHGNGRTAPEAEVPGTIHRQPVSGAGRGRDPGLCPVLPGPVPGHGTGIVALYILSLLIDRVVYGPNAAKVAYIISEQYEAITRELLQLDRGVTLLEGKGAWSGQGQARDSVRLRPPPGHPVKKLVQAVDPNAFVIVCDAHEILGEGFGTYDPTGL